MRYSQDYKTAQQSPIVASWIDVTTTVLGILILVGGSDVLWLVITTLLIIHALTEIIQMYTLTFKYFIEISNWIDIGIIAFTVVILYLPPDLVVNPKIYSFFKVQAIENTDENVNCRVMRCISAIIIVLVAVRFLMSVAKLPRLKTYNLYVIMFFKVMKTYIKIMVWYSLYLIAFGLGFYIMLHDDTNEKKLSHGKGENKTKMPDNSTEEAGKNKFRNPYMALVKTSTMFVGEIEFGDLPIKGGDVSVTMVYMFLVLFIFLMIVVLMNLLNGLAVSDTGKMIKDSLVESQISFISTIRFYESMYIGQMKNKKKSWLKTFINTHFVPKGILLFHSPYIGEHKLTFPIKVKTYNESSNFTCCPSSWIRSNEFQEECSANCCTKILKWFLGKNENDGNDEFLEKARKIVIREKQRKVEERRKNNLIGQKTRRKQRIKDMSKSIISMESNMRQFKSSISESSVQSN